MTVKMDNQTQFDLASIQIELHKALASSRIANALEKANNLG